MSEPMSAERLAKIRARCQKAMDGPWTLSDDIEFTVTAMRDIPDLLAEVDRLRAENAWLTGVVERVRERRRLGEGMQQIQFPSRWFAAAHDAHQQPANAPRSHEHAQPRQPVTVSTLPPWTCDECGNLVDTPMHELGCPKGRREHGTDPAWDGTGE